MKKKSLSELLQRLEEVREENCYSITNLNDAVSKKMLKGGYDTHNDTCSGQNDSCSNGSCHGTSNLSCYNGGCVI